MVLVYEDKKRKVVKGQERIDFSSFSSFHLVVITARVKGKKQISQSATDDEDLIVKIDDKSFPKLNTNRLKDSPATFSGGQLHNLSKTVYYLTFLKGKDHTIVLEADDPPGTVSFESLEVYTLVPEKKTVFNVERQAEDGDRRPWITFVLDYLSLEAVTLTITYTRRKNDSDDVKVKIDGIVQANIIKTIKHLFWRYVGSRLPWSSPTKTETEMLSANLTKGLHYIEFVADRMPVLHKIRFDFGDKPFPSIRIPTVDDPKWTEDFYDDPENILLARLIFGEAENQPKEAKLGVGFTVISRVGKQRTNWGVTVRGVILKESQYDALWNPDRRNAVRDPLRGADETTREVWNESYAAATGILDSSLTDPTDGATHFHSYPEDKPEKFPSWATEENFKIKIGDILFYELER